MLTVKDQGRARALRQIGHHAKRPANNGPQAHHAGLRHGHRRASQAHFFFSTPAPILGRPASQGYERRTATEQRCRALGIVPLSWYIARGQLKTKAAPALYSTLAITQNAQRTTVRKRTTLGSVMATAAHRGHTFSSQPLPQSWGALLRKAMNVAPQLNSVAVR